jgi:hypothetical protein
MGTGHIIAKKAENIKRGTDGLKVTTLLFAVFAVMFCARAFAEDLRGEVSVEMEPVYALFLGVPYPLDGETASRWAREDAAAAFSGMIYGWSFVYEPGERARSIPESLELEARGEVQAGDSELSVTDTAVRDGVFYMTADYPLDHARQNRMRQWRSAAVSRVQATGYGPLQGWAGVTDRRQIKEAALQDAMKKAVRQKIRLTERNRPRAVTGLIALSKFPLYRMNNGQWAATAEFRIEITETIPFAAY